MERPILFSSPMVRAILAGQKSQTRRVIVFKRGSAGLSFDAMGWPFDNDKRGDYHAYFKLPVSSWVASDKPTYIMLKSPYGGPGDRLWVRETFGVVGNSYIYRANFKNGEADAFVELGTGVTAPAIWKPSIHMPRKASRIALEVIDVRVEHVQDIKRDDAKAEGVSNVWSWNKDSDQKYFQRGVLNPYIANFSVLWDEINVSRGFGWDINPWVWVVDFKVVQ